MGASYKDEVIDPGDRVSQLAREINLASHRNCPAVNVVRRPGNFRAPDGYLWTSHILVEMLKQTVDPGTGAVTEWVMRELPQNDGAGGKPQFFTLVGTPEVFARLGWEIIVMNEDVERAGGLGCLMVSDLQVKRITRQNYPLIEAMLVGYGQALGESCLVSITGETAVMKHSITAFCDDDSEGQLILTWGATCIGLAHRDREIDTSRIAPGMVIVGFWEPGYRCNGGTFFTNLLLHRFPDPRRIMENSDAMRFVEQLTIPSRSYSRTLRRVVGWNADGSLHQPIADIAGIGHITGGGVWGKLGEILPEGVGARLDTMPDPAPVLREAQELSYQDDFPNPLSDLEAYGTLHGGCGMMLVCATKEDARKVIAEADKDGIQAQIVGTTTRSEANEIRIMSRFREGRELSSDELVT